MPHNLTEVLADIPADRLMIGSDLPESLEAEIGKILSMEMPEGARRLILGGTARRLFLGETS
jgi:predicted TIM-barrel fold metal-dependent hydrolase